MVKKIILSLLALTSMFVACTASAKEKDPNVYSKVQVSAGVGKCSISEFGEAFGDGFRSAFRGEKACTDYTPTINVQNTYSFSKHFSLGVTVSGQKGTLTTEDHGIERERFHFSVLPTMRLNWVNRPHFGLYSGLGVGIKWRLDDYAKDEYGKDEWSHRIAFQLTGIGAELGFRYFHVFAEAGLGEQGLIQAGVRTRF